MYRIGEHPTLASCNEVWRQHVASMTAMQCLRFLAEIETTWPARKIRP